MDSLIIKSHYWVKVDSDDDPAETLLLTQIILGHFELFVNLAQAHSVLLRILWLLRRRVSRSFEQHCRYSYQAQEHGSCFFQIIVLVDQTYAFAHSLLCTLLVCAVASNRHVSFFTPGRKPGRLKALPELLHELLVFASQVCYLVLPTNWRLFEKITQVVFSEPVVFVW